MTFERLSILRAIIVLSIFITKKKFVIDLNNSKISWNRFDVKTWIDFLYFNREIEGVKEIEGSNKAECIEYLKS